jgi:hypothetical protein
MGILRQTTQRSLGVGILVSALYCFPMRSDATDQTVVWIGVVGVVPREGCELLAPQHGVFINFLTLANSEADYRAKIAGALSYYALDLLEFQDVRPFSRADEPSREILSIAAELEQGRNPQHVRFATFHTFPRVM